MTRIAIVGMACRYPDAGDPGELWENSIAGRRAFRRLPDVRMRLADYWDSDPAAPDRFYSRTAAVIEGYEFDRVSYKIAGSTYRSTDLTHWLALDTAALALADAGFPKAEGLPHERTGVVVGNSLTGEFTRANLMRLRWPYVRRTLAAALADQGWEDDKLAAFLADLEVTYKAPFPPIDEDTLAGGLANTIAGRICNYFDLHGGGFTVDGACSSSLLAVANAGKSLADRDIDVAVAGGVDLSIDPFEIIGFAKTGALARAEMRVYDRRSNGFWPGEGCGMVVLMREEDARGAGHRIYATIAGWGISSDGRGGITRPEVDGYKLAMQRAYERAGFGPDTVPLFEGHGTGTPVGDRTELTALSQAREEADPAAPPAAITTIKGMIGHTKAAAGVAGLIKATTALHEQALPPTLGCEEPHELLTGDRAALRALRTAEPWPAGAPLRAAVSAMGFGGINTHVVLENRTARRRRSLDTRTRALSSSRQDSELLLVDGASAEQLRERVARLAGFVTELSYAQLGDVAATALRDLRDLPHRAAVVAGSPEEARERLERLLEALDAGETRLYEDGCYLGQAAEPARVGFLFPGQGAGRSTSGGALRRRFAEVDEVYAGAALPAGGDTIATAVAQPRIMTGALAALRVLAALGIEATVAVGHSLGELAALHWAGALDEEALLRVARARGQIMTEHSATGVMAAVAALPDRVPELAGGLPVVVAAYNGPGQTVLAGAADAIDEAGRRAAAAEVRFSRLRVSHAFHSPLMEPAAAAFGERLEAEEFAVPDRRIISTITGEALPADVDLRSLLRRQVTAPVRFTQAVEAAAAEVDLFVEAGPGRVLGGLAGGIADVPAVSLDTDDESLGGLLKVAGAAYVSGVPVLHEVLFDGRLIKPLEIGAEFSFFASPCEKAPEVAAGEIVREAGHPGSQAPETEGAGGDSFIEVLRRLAAERAELPPEMVADDSLLLDDLHLSSVTVGQILNQATQRLLGRPAVQGMANLATATIRELAEALEAMAESGPAAAAPSGPPAGAVTWARAFSVDLDEVPLPTPAAGDNGSWRVFAPDPAAARPVREALETAEAGSGILVHLPPECAEEHLETALAGAQAALGAGEGTRFVLVQHGRGAAGLAKTLRQEAPDLRITIVHAPPGPELAARVAAEVAATASFTEVHYDGDGARRIPTLRPLPVRPARTEPALDESDVLLVTGGGKGITAECALAMAVDSGAKLAVLGRSDPDADPDLAATLRRMADSGVRVRYGRADVTDAAQARAAVAAVADELGPVTAVLHGAGRNEPAALSALDPAAFRGTFAPKIDGLRAVLDAVDPDRLRLLVTFGSIIGRAGLPGEAHYATANEWLAEATRDFGARHPGCRAICMEWSVWSEVGMGERLSVVESLDRQGVTPIAPEQGVALLRRLLADPDTPQVVVISGRTEGVDTVRREAPALPLLRFVARPLVRYHGVELVSEVELNAGTDLYLADHLLDGNLLFPAVFGMEAMAQVARAATGWDAVPSIENAEFLQPIVVPPEDSATIRIAVTVTDDDAAEAAIRCADTGFATDHFRARLRFDGARPPAGPPEPAADGLPAVPLDPAAELYGSLLFQGRRFHRLRRYHRAAARDVDADVAAVDAADWFTGYLPADLLLGDPGMRDALMHGNQVCVPHGTLLPAGIERVHPGGPDLAAHGDLRFCATERSRDGDTYIYDIAVRTGAGDVVERWEGLRLRAVRKGDGSGPWPVPLLGPYLERSLDDLLGVPVAVGVEPHGTPDHESVAAGRAGAPAGGTTATCQGPGLTLCVAAGGTVACAVETAGSGTDGGGRDASAALAAELGEEPAVTAARLRAAAQCLGREFPPGPPAARHGAWVVFAAGDLSVATLATTLRDNPDRVIFAILAERRS